MSHKNKPQENDTESVKKFKSSCTNFIKMFSEEKSDSIKLKYLPGLTKLAEKLKIPPEKIVEIIFKNILFEKTDILKSPSLLLAFISFCRKTHEHNFQLYFYELLYNFVNDYTENIDYFKDYLIMFALEIFFDSTKSKDETEDFQSRTQFFKLMIHSDIKEFKEQFFKMVLNDKIILLDNKIKINFIINFFEVIIIKNKYQIGNNLLKLIKEEVDTCLPIEIIDSIINFENKNGFNSIIKKKKEINEFLIFNQMILENISNEYINKKNNENKLDIYLSNLLNILCIKKEFNIEIIKYIFNYYIMNKYPILNKMFTVVIYYLSNFAHTTNQNKILFNTICKYKELNPVYKWIMFKNPIIYNKALLINADFKLNLNGINITMDKDSDNENNNINDLIHKTLIVNEESNVYLLTHLTLYDFILNLSFNCNNDNNYIINFYSLNKVLLLISEMSLEQINKIFYKEFVQFLLDYLLVLFEFSLSLKNHDNNQIIIKTFETFFNIFRKMVNTKETQLSIIFPSVITIFNNKDTNIELIEPFIDYMIDTFARSTRQNDMVFKLIKAQLFIQKNLNDRFILADKLINLVIKANEHKLFESLFSLCNELVKTKDDFNLKLNYYIINKYSKFYTGALSDLLQKYIIGKFDEAFLQKNISIDKLTDDDYYIINTIDNIYLQDKPTNLKDIVDKFYGDSYKRIIGIFDNLFEYMDKDENNKNIFKINAKEKTLVEEYTYMKNNLKEILDYYSFIKKDYTNNNSDNFKENRKLFCIYDTTYYLVHLLTQYISEKIENERSITNEDERKIENDKLMLIFDYIHDKVLLNKNIKNSTFKTFFINITLCDNNVLDYYLDKHTNNLVNAKIKEEQSDLSKLNELSSSINSKKAFGLIKLLKDDTYNIILMNQLILTLFTYESDTIINPQKIDLYKNKSNKYLIIKNIYINKLFDKVNEFKLNANKNDNNKLNACFSRKFFNLIIDLSSKSLDLNKLYFLFCLDNEVINNYYSSFSDFFDFDYITLEFYSLVRNKNCPLEFKEKFLEFLKNFNFIEGVHVFSLRIFSNVKTFEKLISKCDNHSEITTSLLNDIVILLINNLLKYNSYQNYTENIILNIINNIFAYTSELLFMSKNNKNLSEKINKELKYLWKSIKYIFENFSTENSSVLKQEKNIKTNERTNINLLKNVNKVLENRFNCNNLNNNDKELLNFVKLKGNIDEQNNKQKIYMDKDLIISNYVNNPKQYPYPVEIYISKIDDKI